MEKIGNKKIINVHLESEDNMIEKSIRNILMKYPQVLYGYTSIEYSNFSNEYKSALVIAVPYDKQLTLKNYSEVEFENTIGRARETIHTILKSIEELLQYQMINYYIPPEAQNDETELVAPFSFKFAAIKSGIGWIGKNDVVITERYGPRIRLSAILIDYSFTHGKPYLESHCPKDCNLCVNICPYRAVKGTIWNVNTYRDIIIDYHLCNEKRSLFKKEHGRKNACGLCMVACPYGEM